VEGRSSRDLLVIDGQRLATLSIFAMAVIQKLLEMADEGIEPEAYRERAKELIAA
jgi:hypothetical protein